MKQLRKIEKVTFKMTVQSYRPALFAVFFMLSVSFFVSGCGKLKNTNSNDALVYGSSVTGTSNFLNARGVMATKCFSCHSSWGNYSESDFISNGLVVARSTTGSSLYTRTRGNDTGIAGDMPVGGPNLSSTELTTIKTWINGI